MTDDRLPTELWVSAHLRLCAQQHRPAYVVRRGAAAAGTVLLRLVRGRQQSTVLTQSRDLDGVLGWMDPFDGEIVDDQKADAYIQRSIARDPDLWVIDVESPDGANPFEGKVFS